MSAWIYVEHPDCHGDHSLNVTHNLGPMFREAGVDWRDYDYDKPDEQRTVALFAPQVAEALVTMRHDPPRFEAMNPPNGWGNYDIALLVLEQLLEWCMLHPDGTVDVSR